MFAWRRIVVVGCLSWLVIVAGCSRRPATTQVTGKVSYRNQPVTDAQVMFVSASGRPAFGKTDHEGRFDLMTYLPGDGAVPGEHRITVIKNMPLPTTPDDPYTRFQNVLPKEYESIETTVLKETVTLQGDNDFELILED